MTNEYQNYCFAVLVYWCIASGASRPWTCQVEIFSQSCYAVMRGDGNVLYDIRRHFAFAFAFAFSHCSAKNK